MAEKKRAKIKEGKKKRRKTRFFFSKCLFSVNKDEQGQDTKHHEFHLRVVVHEDGDAAGVGDKPANKKKKLNKKKTRKNLSMS